MKTLDKINNLKNQYGSRFIKYQRNLRKYYNCPNISLDNIRQSTAVGLMLDGNGFAATALAKPSINIIMSIIDTLTSKIATMKARPFFNTVDGTYADRQYVRDKEEIHLAVRGAFCECHRLLGDRYFGVFLCFGQLSAGGR